jgi:nitrogen fixation protein FixH
MKTDRNFWPVGIMVFFTAFFAGIAVVLVIASTHQDALVSENYYEQELKFQDQIDAAARTEKTGAKIQYDSAAGKLLIVLPGEQANQIISGKISIYRASAPKLDREFPLELHIDGTQAIDVSQFTAGPWQIRVRWKAGDQDYFLERKFIL